MNESCCERKCKYTIIDGQSGFTLDVSGMKFTDSEIAAMKEKFDKAHAEMQKLESGAIKNPDENRKVTHFTDRAEYIKSPLFKDVEAFARNIRSGKIKASTGKKFKFAVINGIGGSALGPQLMQFAIKGPYWNELCDGERGGFLKIYFLDNTDTAGLADVLKIVEFDRTIVINISKSGGTQETKNNMIALENEFANAGISFAKHSCAITMKDSSLDKHARSAGWLKIFEMAESIGGRTSETSIVGHLPAALAGVDFKSFLSGACHMDILTRNSDYLKNPAYLLAAMWYIAGKGKGDRNMVIVPYSDRLVLLSRYLQQLVMESLGKEKDLTGKTVNQGLNVFGNKGGTDAHAFIQQLNDGRDDFFVTFIEVLKDTMDIEIERGVMMGDYLHGFEAGLASALKNKGRQVIEMAIQTVDEFSLGMIIGLYERAVAVYAEFIGINAFHQPGVQAYKLASKTVIDLLGKIESGLAAAIGFTGTDKELAEKLGIKEEISTACGILAKLAENSTRNHEGFYFSRSWDNTKGWIYKVEEL